MKKEPEIVKSARQQQSGDRCAQCEMKKLIPILIAFVLTSCLSKYEKAEVMEYFTEINELNEIIKYNRNNLQSENFPDSIANKIPKTEKLIQTLKNQLDLTDIRIYNIDGEIGRLGIAYQFGKLTTGDRYSYLIFSEQKENLESFIHYEQFSDCSESETVNDNWAFSIITPNCNN